MDQGEALRMVERSLRRLIRSFDASDANALSRAGYGPEDIARLDEKRRIDAAARRSADLSSDGLLEFVELRELAAIVLDQWDRYGAPLGRKDRWKALLGEVERRRNPTAHSRELLIHERDLLSGIAGEIRNLVTIHLSHRDASYEFYPTIDFCRDSFGLSADVSQPESMMSFSSSGQILTPGDVVEYEAHGTDPQGRTLAWVAGVFPSGVDQRESGETARFQWRVTDAHVGQSMHFQIRLMADGVPHHRHLQKYDHSVDFLYTVHPQRAEELHRATQTGDGPAGA